MLATTESICDEVTHCMPYISTLEYNMNNELITNEIPNI